MPAPRQPSPVSRILFIARESYWSHGYASITMDDLAKRLKISKKTLYKHFPTKRDLLAAVIEFNYIEIKDQIDAITNSEHDHAEKLKLMMEAMRARLRRVNPVFLRDISAMEPDLYERLKHNRAIIINTHARRFLEEGAQGGSIRTDIPFDVLTKVIVTILNEVLNPNKLQELDLTVEEASRTIYTLIFKGLHPVAIK